jgi:hypothetical protein
MYKVPSQLAGSRADLYHDRGWKDSHEQLGEHSATIEPTGRSRAAPESAKRQAPAYELVGAKRPAPV